MSNPISRNSGLGKIIEAAFDKAAQPVTMDKSINQRRDQNGRIIVDPQMSAADFNATSGGAKIPNAQFGPGQGYGKPGMTPIPQKVTTDLVKTWRNELAGADPAQQAQLFESFIQPFKGSMSPEQIEGIKKAVGVQSAPAPVPQVGRIPAAQPAPAPAAPTGPQPVV